MFELIKPFLPSATDLAHVKSQKHQKNFSCGTQFLEGKALVTDTIQPGKAGRVWFQGAFWFAMCQAPLTFQSDETVYVSGLLEGNTLKVEPVRFSSYTLLPS
jgi:membrane protein implicated in regulation of membrane protease activity